MIFFRFVLLCWVASCCVALRGIVMCLLYCVASVMRCYGYKSYTPSPLPLPFSAIPTSSHTDIPVTDAREIVFTVMMVLVKQSCFCPGDVVRL